MLNKIIPNKIFNKITRTNNLKTIALASAMTLASTGLISCNNGTNESKMELKKTRLY